MGLTRPRFEQLNTIITNFTDPISVLNKGSTQANIDVGFIFNRDGGINSNVALFWNESANSFVTAFTTDSGIDNANVTVTEYANIKVNSLTGANVNITGNATARFFYGNGSQLTGIITSVTKIINGTSDITAYDSGNIAVSVGGSANTVVFTSANIHVTGSIIPTANVTYDLGAATRRFRDAYFSGNTIYLGNAILSTSGSDLVISTSGGFGVPVGTTEQRSTTLGAIRYNTTLSKFEAYDGVSWNSLAYGTLTDFPTGDYGDLTATTTDAFGIATASGFDCNDEGPIATTDLGALT